MDTRFSKHFQALKSRDGSGYWFNVSVYELINAVMKATGCNKIEAEENINCMLEDCYDVHVNGFSYSVQEVL